MAESGVTTDACTVCPKCGGENAVTMKDWMEAWGKKLPTEYETSCTNCGYAGYWAYGYFQPDVVSGTTIGGSGD